MYFLQAHSMDFNKWIKEGVPYMNREQIFELEKKLQEEISFEHLKFINEWEEE